MPHWLNISFHIFILLVMLGGVLISLLPIVPGVLIIWLAALIYGLVTGFGTWGLILFILLTLLTVFGMLVDNLLMGAKTRKAGASWYALGFAILAGIAGSFFFPPLGGLIAVPIALYVVELIRLRDFNRAWLIFKAVLASWGLSSLARFGTGLVMVAVWGIWVKWG